MNLTVGEIGEMPEARGRIDHALSIRGAVANETAILLLREVYGRVQLVPS